MFSHRSDGRPSRTTAADFAEINKDIFVTFVAHYLIKHYKITITAHYTLSFSNQTAHLVFGSNFNIPRQCQIEFGNFKLIILIYKK